MADAAPRQSPSPWSRFLSPSLFSQRSTPGAAPAVPAGTGPSPLKEASTVPQPHQPGLFTHAKEINPFERSFAVLDTATPPPGFPARFGYGPSAQVVAFEGQQDHPDEAARGPGKRKRAMSSPAVLTPGGSALQDPFALAGAEAGGLAEFIQKAKRPTLHMSNQDSGIGMLDARDLVPVGPSTRSSEHGSFDSSSGSSLLRHRRGASLSESPDTSIAPSPPSPKLGQSPAMASSSSRPASAAAYSHFQAQPMPFAMPIGPSSTALAQAAIYTSAPAMAPTSIAPDAVVPPTSLPFSSGPAAPSNVAIEAGLYRSHAPPTMPTAAPFGHMEPQLPQPYFDPAFAVSGPPPPPPASGPPAAFDPAMAVPQANIFQPNQVAMPYSSYPPLPPLAIPVGAQIPPQLPSAAPTAGGSVAAASMSPVSTAHRNSFAGPAPSDRSSTTPAPVKPPPTGKKRGRKPKNWDPELEKTVELDPVEQEKQRKLALERNRVAASKSRRRKKERVELLETAASELCSRNVALQAECRTLLTEVHNLRAYMTQAHPQGACQCQHINGYLKRESEGGGIPAILYGAGTTLDRDYTHPPKWGSEDDAVAGAAELEAFEAITKGGSLREMHDMHHDDHAGPGPSAAPKAKPAASSSGTAPRPGLDARPSDLPIDDFRPVVSRAKAAIPLRPNASPPAKRPGMATRLSSSIVVNPEPIQEEPSDAECDEGDEHESDGEKAAPKSRRARAIPLRRA